MKKWFIPGLTAIAALAIIGVAFGQQGSPTSSSSSPTPSSGTPSSGSASVQQFHADLKPLNDSGVSGTVAISVVDGQLGAQVQAQGLTPGQMHAQNIHQMSSGSASCPTSGSSGSSSTTTPSSGSSSPTSTSGSSSSNGTSTSGTPSASGASSTANIISAIQGESSYGPAVMALTQQQFPVATGSGQILYANVFQNANVSSSSSSTPSASGTSSSSGTPTNTPATSITSLTATPGTSSAVTPPAGSSAPGGISTPGAATTPASGQPLTLTKDVVVLQGMVVNGTFDPTAPVACGEIQQGAATGALGTPVAGQTPGAGVGGAATTPSASKTASASETAGTGSMTPSSSGTSSSGTPVETPTP
ncbi:MAG TPA: hypothetical protein VFY79_07895 [Dehalococcoidia bacterium]|nr:hypothetical protein [Dehalococcoidia bacterium]